MNQNLLLKYISGKASQREKEEVAAWIDADAANLKEFMSLRKSYDALVWQDADELKTGRDKLLSLRTFTMKAMRIAAIFVLAFGLSYILIQTLQKENVEMQTVYVPAGQRTQVTLADGTMVWVNGKSTLTFPSQFASRTRKVELDGEAFFDVEHNEHKPFVVSTEKLDIKVLGTKFNVFAYKGREEFNTALLEGSVKVYERMNEEKALFMNPNECVELKDNKLVKRPMGNTDFLLWKEGIYAFDDVPFEDIIKKFELYYDIVITVNNSKLMKYKFSGKFRQRDGVESALRTLRKVYYFTYIKDEENNNIVIR